jgi:tetratricopeptide (TPR) repeat protein
MRSLPRILVLATALTALSGCQSFPLTSWMFKRSDRGAPATSASDGSRSLAEGREALQNGRPAAAIVSLRLALLDASTRAPASNALGVAYAQLGREDLAERYFKSAIAADPSDERFVANLLRLQQTVLARKAQSDAARLAALQGEAKRDAAGFVADKAQPVSEQPRTVGDLERRSRNEVFIASSTTPTAPTATVAYAARPNAGKAAAAGNPAEPVPAAKAAAPRARLIDNPFSLQPPATAGEPR